mmetsp:Transcript_12469/g.38906  ORF Transcript_12469/g.38906 Transcript_12469/m.38906 type:complete len:299 (-) Transcript_12469:721-1617(-)
MLHLAALHTASPYHPAAVVAGRRCGGGDGSASGVWLHRRLHGRHAGVVAPVPRRARRRQPRPQRSLRRSRLRRSRRPTLKERPASQRHSHPPPCRERRPNWEQCLRPPPRGRPCEGRRRQSRRRQPVVRPVLLRPQTSPRMCWWRGVVAALPSLAGGAAARGRRRSQPSAALRTAGRAAVAQAAVGSCSQTTSVLVTRHRRGRQLRGPGSSIRRERSKLPWRRLRASARARPPAGTRARLRRACRPRTVPCAQPCSSAASSGLRVQSEGASGSRPRRRPRRAARGTRRLRGHGGARPP